MGSFIVFLFEIFLLFLLSSQVTRAISSLLFRLTRNQKMTIYLFSILFLPGTIIHELSHMIMAGILFVPVGTIDFTPKIMEDRVRLGSVAIGKVDPIRRMLVGIAPVIVGLSLIVSFVYFFLPQLSFQALLSMPVWLLVVLFYALFQVSNTMFSSKKDMEGTIELALVLLVLIGLVSILNRTILTETVRVIVFNRVIQNGLTTIDTFLLISLGIDSIVYVLFYLLKKNN